LTAAQPAPEQTFGVGGVATKDFGEMVHARSTSRQFGDSMTPIYNRCVCSAPSAPDYGGTSPETGEEYD
jgi:hypothetical protein